MDPFAHLTLSVLGWVLDTVMDKVGRKNGVFSVISCRLLKLQMLTRVRRIEMCTLS